MHLGLVDLPEHLQSLALVGNPWVIAVAALGAVAEFFADKIAWIDTAWDAVHSIARPLGGAILALAIIDPGQPLWQILILLLGGSAALASHGAKASARAAVNLSPEPVSNIILSGAEDVATTGGLVAALFHPVVALAIAALMTLAAVGIAVAVRRFARDVRDFLPDRTGKPED